VVPERNRGREPAAKGQAIARLVPADKTLYLSRLKDEGIMFYYRRPVLRVPDLDQLPSSDGSVYCILDKTEAQHIPPHTQALLHLTDEQGDPITLIRRR
jgi:hypothetical protein